MAQSTTAGRAWPRARLNLSAFGARVAGYTILAAVFGWLILNLVDNPTQFFSAAIFGISNGALYALIALGYSLVYGIIELINFAHGDLFMLGTLFSAFMVGLFFGDTPVGVGGLGWLTL